MNYIVKVSMLVLSVALILGWSSVSTAQPERKKRKDGRSASVEKKSSKPRKSRSSARKSKRRVKPARKVSRPTPPPRRETSKSRTRSRRSGASSHSRPVWPKASSRSRPVRPKASSHSNGGSKKGKSLRRDRHAAPGQKHGISSKRGGGNRVRHAAKAPGKSRAHIPSTLKRGGRSYDQEPVTRDGEIVVRRTSVHVKDTHHPVTVHYYHHYYWGHTSYYCYLHYWPYAPWFWGFYWAPFHAPWYYTWGWIGAPWYHTWGWYYYPYPSYVGPSYWVTDYMLSKTLEEEYERGYIAGQESVGTPISEPVKEQLRQQVDDVAKAFEEDRWIELEQALQDPDYLFIVDAPLSVTTADDTTCTLTGGDIFKTSAPGAPDVPVASMMIVTSKSVDCPAGSTVKVSYTDLQEMLNSFSEKVDDGMNELQKNRGEQEEGGP
jgi:hypothetical protein